MSKEFMFGPQHVGKKVRHEDGRMGRIMSVSNDSCSVDWGDKRTSYMKDGRHYYDGDVVVFLDEPDLPHSTTGQENKSNVGQWLDWARYETIDHDGQIWQYENRPTPNPFRWDVNRGRAECVGTTAEPKDHSKTLIERYCNEPETTSQPEQATWPDYDETPFIPNRAEVWARFMAAAMAQGDESDWTQENAAKKADKALQEYEKRFLNQQLTSNEG